jgi:hypothetical protein
MVEKNILCLDNKKKGQIYLISAVIIISLIIGFATVSNYVFEGGNTRVYDLGEELSIESNQVIGHGIYNEFNEDELEKLLEHFLYSYVNFTQEDLVFILGNKEEVVVYNFVELVGGEITLDLGEDKYSKLQISNRKVEKRVLIPNSENKIEVTIGDATYDFELKPGENFYFAVSKEIEGETHVATGG